MCDVRVAVTGVRIGRFVQWALVTPVNEVRDDIRHHFRRHVGVQNPVDSGNDYINDRFQVHETVRANH